MCSMATRVLKPLKPIRNLNINMALLQKTQKRTKNFLPDEKRFLLQLIENEKHIIENKLTNAVVNTEKANAWLKVARLFNERNIGGIHRTVDAIKYFYKNQKKDTRSLASKYRQDLYKSGDGEYSASPLPVIAKVTTLVNVKTPDGLSNAHDSDGTIRNSVDEPTSASVASTESDENYEEITENGNWIPGTSTKRRKSRVLTSPWSKRRGPANMQGRYLAQLKKEVAITELEKAKLELEMLKNNAQVEEVKNTINCYSTWVDVCIKKKERIPSYQEFQAIFFPKQT